VGPHEKPHGWSDHAVDFINNLLIRKQQNRLGSDQPGIAKSHPWFENFDWDSLNNQTMKSPFEGIVTYNLILRKLRKLTIFTLIKKPPTKRLLKTGLIFLETNKFKNYS
jgi:hypothetical protein